MLSVLSLCIKATSLVVCFVLLRIANKLLISASKEKSAGLDDVLAVSRIGVFVHCLLCTAEVCEIILTHAVETGSTLDWIYDDNVVTNNTNAYTNHTNVKEEDNCATQQHISAQSDVVVKQLQFIWLWSYQNNMLHMRQIYTHHSKRIHTSMLILYYHTAHFFSRTQSDRLRELGHQATNH
jgi:hypothetical protein